MANKILLTNIHSCHNAGDAALTYVAVRQLIKYFPSSHITLAMDDPESYTGEYPVIESVSALVRRENRWSLWGLLQLVPASLIPTIIYRLFGKAFYRLIPRRWRPLLQAYLGSNLVVSKPGGFLYSSGKGLSLLLSLYTLGLAILAGKPVYMFPQSLGPFLRPWEGFITKRILKRMRIVMTREIISFRQLQDWGLSSRSSHLVPDLAFAYPGASVCLAKEWLRDNMGLGYERGIPLLGMTVINWEAQNPDFNLQAEYESACSEAARFFVEQYAGRVILFPQVWGPSPSQDDRVPTRRIASRLCDLSSSVFMIEEPIRPNLLKAIYGLMDIFIGTRMHSNIFAMSEGVPVIAIGYQPKTEGITKMVSLERWAINIDEVTKRSLTELLVALYEEQEIVRTHLNRMIPALQKRADLAGAMIASDFSELQGGTSGRV